MNILWLKISEGFLFVCFVFTFLFFFVEESKYIGVEHKTSNINAHNFLVRYKGIK